MCGIRIANGKGVIVASEPEVLFYWANCHKANS
jgi:hypothetical protein